MKTCLCGAFLIVLGALTFLFWLLLTYYGLPDWFERDAVRTMFAIWKYVAIAEMVVGGMCFFEAGRKWLSGDHSGWDEDEADESAKLSNTDKFCILWFVLQNPILFCLVLILSHWIWFIILSILGFFTVCGIVANWE